MSGALYFSLAINVLAAAFIQWNCIQNNKERASWLDIIDQWKKIAASRLASIEELEAKANPGRNIGEGEK